jgi:hypothetical protein
MNAATTELSVREQCAGVITELVRRDHKLCLVGTEGAQTKFMMTPRAPAQPLEEMCLVIFQNSDLAEAAKAFSDLGRPADAQKITAAQQGIAQRQRNNPPPHYNL